jgi:hypothetical protein
MHAGSWSPEEESRLVQIMRDFHSDGKSTQTSSRFWKEVSQRMGHTRTAHQCRNKWCAHCSCIIGITVVSLFTGPILYTRSCKTVGRCRGGATPTRISLFKSMYSGRSQLAKLTSYLELRH